MDASPADKKALDLALSPLTKIRGVDDFSIEPLGPPGKYYVYMIGTKLPVDDFDEGNGSGVNQKIKNLVDDIPASYKKLYKCKQFASALKSKMISNGISGEFINLQSVRNVYSDKFGIISSDGIHQAIKVGDKVYDNLRPNGVSYADWIKDLGGEVYLNPPHGKLTINKF